MRTTVLRIALLVVAAAWLPLAGACSGNVNNNSIGTINVRMMSLSSAGSPGTNGGRQPTVSYDGRYVAFESSSNNLDPRDTNTIDDIYVRDTVTNTTTLVSVSSSGLTGANDYCSAAFISPDERFVAFASRATNLVTGLTDANNRDDLFVRDLYTDTTVCVSVRAVSSTTTTLNGSEGFYGFNVVADAAAVYVVFTAYGADYVAGTTTDYHEVYLRRIPLVGGVMDNIIGGLTILLTRTSSPTIASNGFNVRPTLGQDAGTVYVAWQSNALASVFVAGAIEGNTSDDVFWRSVTKTGWPLAPTVSAVLLVSDDDAGGVKTGDGTSLNPSLSGDGNFVVFESAATDLVPAALDANGSTKDIFRRGPMTGVALTEIVSLDSFGSQSTQDCVFPSVSGGGDFVCFQSGAPDLVPGDIAGFDDVFIRNILGGTTARMSLTTLGAEPNNDCRTPRMSEDGTTVAFESGASNMVGGAITFSTQVYRRAP